MRVLALDPGTVRIGVALSDELQMIASPQPPLAAEPEDALLRSLAELVRDKQVELILLGLPRNMNGTFGPAAERARALGEKLRAALGVPVREWDERLTSAQAERALIEGGVRREQRKGKTDSVAAAILLQSYLDAQG
ncbi:MAG: Holliday junction resolvase RuvX [Limisphaerales bacterium]